MIFERIIDGAVYISLGHATWCALGWPLTSKIVDGEIFYILNPAGHPQFLFALESDGSQWQGITVGVRAPIEAPGTSAIITWARCGPNQDLLKFSLRNGVHLLKPDFIRLCSEVKAAVTRLPGEKGFSTRAYAKALVDKIFRDEPEETRRAILDRLASSRSKSGISTARGKQVLAAFDQFDPEDFKLGCSGTGTGDSPPETNSKAIPRGFSKGGFSDLAPGLHEIRNNRNRCP